VVELEVVVEPDGTVGPVRVVKSLDTKFGLDDQAVATARQWRFKPAQIGTRPVAMLVTLILEFRLHNREQTGAQPAAPGTVRQSDPGVFPPIAVKAVTPRYTAEAMRQKLQGQVTLEAVVNTEGRVSQVKVVKSLDTLYGLDDAAVAAAREWQFEPGTLNGKPVAVAINLVLEFRLH
jgi:TonB family protein